MQKKSFRFDKKVCVGKNLNLGICSKFWGNFEGILGNPGEIPHIGWKTLGVYRDKQANRTLMTVVSLYSTVMQNHSRWVLTLA